MSGDEADFEAAEAFARAERDTAVARIRQELASEGENDCIDCGRPIGARRKAALPSAERCITCQTAHEQRGHAKRGARGY